MKTLILFYLVAPLTAVLAFAPPASQAVRLGTGSRCASLLIDGFPLSLPYTDWQIPEALTVLKATALPTVSEDLIAWASMGLLAVEFGVMPTLQKKCVPKKLCRSSMVLAQEVGKFTVAAACFRLFSNPIQRRQALLSWTIASWWRGAGIPAFLYAVQNYAKLMAYQHLSPVAYSVLNQTKTITAAAFCYWLLGIPQSRLQMVSLCILLLSALVMEGVVPVAFPKRPLSLSSLHWKCNHNQTQSKLFSCVALEKENFAKSTPSSVARDEYHIKRGVLPLLLANLTSGLAAALGQREIQRRNLFLYGMELSSASFLMVLFSLLWSQDRKKIQSEGWKRHWNAWVWIPIAAHAVGGQLVGVVTKYAGSVKKGFSLIFGVMLSGVFQKQFLRHEPVTREQVVGALLACFSLWMHASFPPTKVG